jgi:nucleotide-binding universal stress UspA family protein
MRLTGWNRILAPTDLSPTAERAVRYAHTLAEALGSELHVLHVAQDAAELSVYVPATGVVDPDNLSDDYHRWLATLLGERGTIRRVEAVRIGADVAETIRAYAEQQEIDLVVMGTHGRTGLLHLLAGSVAEKMLRVSPCPVLTIRP